MATQKKELIYPTLEEDAAITAAALSDPDSLPFTDEEWARAKPSRGFGQLAKSKDVDTPLLSDGDVQGAPAENKSSAK